MECDNCEKKWHLQVCSGCKYRKYCSADCQLDHWNSQHKNECFDRSKLSAVIKKAQRERLARHIDGDTTNNTRENLAYVSVIDAFENKDWTVDAVCVLSDEEYKIWKRARELLPTF